MEQFFAGTRRASGGENKAGRERRDANENLAEEKQQ